MNPKTILPAAAPKIGCRALFGPSSRRTLFKSIAGLVTGVIGAATAEPIKMKPRQPGLSTACLPLTPEQERRLIQRAKDRMASLLANMEANRVEFMKYSEARLVFWEPHSNEGMTDCGGTSVIACAVACPNDQDHPTAATATMDGTANL